VPQRFLTLADVAEELAISSSQAYALVRSGELRAIKVGGRGQWRVEASELQAFIDRMYAATDAYIKTNPAPLDV
jgi:excisionase family DNA binding protein